MPFLVDLELEDDLELEAAGLETDDLEDEDLEPLDALGEEDLDLLLPDDFEELPLEPEEDLFVLVDVLLWVLL